ncbi:MAG TPA: ATP-binding cassette domain-containing protein, partial [Exilispira sp.]|nr:ATP-binding cassette domain-containing protein [Exilispira sp.]
LNTEPEIVDREVVHLEKIEGDVKIQNLTFAYDKSSKPVLKNINIHIEKGSSLGIMGKPGSGKSTLVSLLFHLFPVPENSIFIDGYDINEIPLNVIRKAIGYVPQDSFLFSDTLANNIALGIPEDKIDMEKIINYAKIAAIHDDIMELKDGYSTVIGERGITLSGGQKQRVSIARALICEPSILILDDALSAVDAQTERTILNLIRKEIEKRTSIIIAHRISTVKDCDNIIVIEDGSIIEQGTHSQLIKNKGYYSRLYDLQRLAEDLKAEKEA